MSHDLQNYIKQSRAMGFGDDDIRAELIKAGWMKEDVDRAFGSSPNSSTAAPGMNGQKLPGTFAILKEAFRQFGEHWKQYIVLSLLPLLALIPFLLVFFAFSFLTGDKAEDGALMIVLGILSLLFLVVLVIGSVWTQTALMYAIAHEGTKVRESLRSSWHRILPLIWVYILSGFVTMGGMLLFVIPGIILSVNLLLVAYVALKEDKRGLHALTESTNLIRGYWWATFGRLFVIWVLYFIVFGAPFLILSSVSDDERWAGAVNIIQQPFSFIFGIIFSIVVYRFYVHLRARKNEGTVDETRKRKTKYKILGVLGVLSVILFFLLIPVLVFVTLGSARTQSQDAQQVSDIKQLQVALELYAADQGSYPVAPDGIMIGDDKHDRFGSDGFEDDAAAKTAETYYMSEISIQPEEGYLYTSADGTTYTIVFSLKGPIAGLDKGAHTATPEGIY